MKPNEYITCRELIDFLADYLDGTLAPAMRHEFERHLKVCPSCVNYLESYRQTVSLGKTLAAPDEAAPPSVPHTLVRAIELARRKQA